MIRDAGEADGAEKDGVVTADTVEAVVRHHASVAREVLAAPRVLVPVELEAVLAARRFQDALALGDDFLADAVACNDRDAIGGHCYDLEEARRARIPRASGITAMRCVGISTSQCCMPHLRMVRCSMVRKMTFSTKSPIRITVNRPAKTFGISSRFLFSKTYQPRPPDP